MKPKWVEVEHDWLPHSSFLQHDQLPHSCEEWWTAICQVRHILPVEASASTSPPTTCSAASFSSHLQALFTLCDPWSWWVPRSGHSWQIHSLQPGVWYVFNSSISKYNGASGKIEAVVNIGPTLSPQHKGRRPQYNGNTLEELKISLINSKLLASLQTPSKSTSMWSTWTPRFS